MWGSARSPTGVRHPAVTAMEASTLANAYPGRFTLGIGHGVPAWVAQMHLTPQSVLGSMREAITDVEAPARGREPDPGRRLLWL